MPSRSKRSLILVLGAIVAIAAVTAVIARSHGPARASRAGSPEFPPPAPSSSASASPQAAPPARCPRGELTAASITVFRESSGGPCIPTSRLALVRCRREAPRAAWVGREHFLGGQFAIRVPGPPDGARRIGVNDDGAQVFLAGRNLYVVRPRATVKFLRLPASPPPRRLAVLGDSIILGAESSILSGLGTWNTHFDAEVSRSTVAGLSVIRATPSAYRNVVVIELGANDGGEPTVFGARARAILAALRSSDLVLWLTIHEVRSYYPLDNQVIREVMAAHPNAAVGAWNGAVPPDGVASDGLHLNDVGAQAMTDLLRSYLRPWFGATRGRGPVGCFPPTT